MPVRGLRKAAETVEEVLFLREGPGPFARGADIGVPAQDPGDRDLEGDDLRMTDPRFCGDPGGR